MKPATGSRLDSWKSIADYLNRNVRTVTRWADERGLPVHHVPGGKRGAVFAFAEEIDAWLVNHGNGSEEGSHPTAKNRPAARLLESYEPVSDGVAAIQGRREAKILAAFPARLPALKYWQWLLAVVLLIASVPIARILFPLGGRASQPFSVKFDADALEVQDTRDRTLWVHQYGRPVDDSEPAYNQARVADFFRDGNREIAAMTALRSGPNPSEEDQREVDFFSGTGKLLWGYVPGKAFQFGTHELRGPWALLDLLVSQSESQTRLWTVAGHRTWGNSFVVQLDPYTGHDALRFVNTGVLYRLNELKTPSGRFLLAGGFNNEWDGGSLAIINEDREFAASPQTPGTRHFCDSCPRGVPDYYFVFPRSEINQLAGVYEDSVTDIRVAEDGIEVRKYERRSQGNENTIYLLASQPPFELLSLRYDSDYDMLHRKWSAEGKLTHSLENCPERAHPQPVRLWTPSSGWTDVSVKPAKANQ